MSASYKVLIVNEEELSSKGKQIYERIKDVLEPGHKGEICAIEVDSGDYFLASSVIEATKEGRKKYPDRVFYFVRIGFPVVHAHR